MEWIELQVLSGTTWDERRIEVKSGTTASDIASQLGLGHREGLVAVRHNGELMDLGRSLDHGGELQWIAADSTAGLEILRHSTAHLLAHAVMRLWPEVRLAVGPAIEHGFYYDFDFGTDRAISEGDLERIEAEMHAIAAQDLLIERDEIPLVKAQALFHNAEALYKLELLADLAAQDALDPLDIQEYQDPQDPQEHQGPQELQNSKERPMVSVYRQGEFVDLCRGPHVPSTGRVGCFKLLHTAGAYWRGDASRPMLQRIYGAAFAHKDDLEQHLANRREAARRDHRRLGVELDLFSVQPEGPGFPFFHPKGMVLRRELEGFWRDVHQERGYEEVQTPVLLRQELWHTSGHMQFFKENMYFADIDNGEYALKPMNCPGGMLLFKRKTHSYRDLPLRMGELGLVHRHELSGTLHGLMRARCFTQDDAHIFMTTDQMTQEIAAVIQLIDYVYSDVFGFPYHVELSTKPAKAMGDDSIWELATDALESALRNANLPFQINEGDGAFYGPKIDFHLRDCLERTWQCGTIQLDFLLPERFDLHYVGADGQRHRPIMLHRVLFGSLERFLAILTEHFAGAFPTWLAPVQVLVIPVSDEHADYASHTKAQLRQAGIRADMDGRSEKVGYKIRHGQTQKVPYMLIVGQREQERATVSIRHRGRQMGEKPLSELIAHIRDEIVHRRLAHEPASQKTGF